MIVSKGAMILYVVKMSSNICKGTFFKQHSTKLFN